MKKTLLSIALLGASAAYVGAANHVFDRLEGTDRELEAMIAPPAATVIPPRSSSVTFAAEGESGGEPNKAVVAPVEPTVPSRLRASSLTLADEGEAEDDEEIEADDAPLKSLPPSLRHAPAPPTSVASAAPQDPALPPLPRPRPADAPSIQTAQAADVATNGSLYSDGSYTGTDENAYYGRVQVQVTISGGRITAVDALDYPRDRRTSRYINSQALPLLEQEVIQAQNARVDGVSGATLTSEAYVRSLRRALAQAGGSNA